jgi:predicted RNA binding protein YcfA (HicA-like mRNA interferase family)
MPKIRRTRREQAGCRTRTDALLSQLETGKINCVHPSLFRPVATRRVPSLTRDGGLGFRDLVATRGSHRQYKHPNKPGRVTVAGKPSDDLAPGTRNSIMKQTGLKEQR